MDLLLFSILHYGLSFIVSVPVVIGDLDMHMVSMVSYNNTVDLAWAIETICIVDC